MHRPATLLHVPFFGGYISCPSHDNTPPTGREDKREDKEISGWLQNEKKRKAAVTGGAQEETRQVQKGNEAMPLNRNTLEDKKEKLDEAKTKKEQTEGEIEIAA